MKKAEVSPHVRLTPSQVRFLFDSGHLRPSGYLFLLLSSLKQHDLVYRIENVDEFCEKWGISRSAFYRAKAKLICDYLLSESIFGGVDIYTQKLRSSMRSHSLPDEVLPLVRQTFPWIVCE